ncbi:MAG: pilus assembly FimT family protein [Terriglobia bacterium]
MREETIAATGRGLDFPAPCPAPQDLLFRHGSMGARHGERGFTLVELVIVVAIALIVSAMAVPQFVTIRRNYRSLGDSRNIHSEIVLAKMRAAANFTRARARFDLNARSYRLEIWNRATNVWATEGGIERLTPDVRFGVGALTTPPPSTQAILGQSPECRPGDATGPAGGAAIANTACVEFNSRGIPVDTGANPFGNNGIYITDGTSVYGSTVSITGQAQAWRAEANVANWTRR